MTDHPHLASVEHLTADEGLDPRDVLIGELRAAVRRLIILVHRQHDGSLETCELCANDLELLR